MKDIIQKENLPTCQQDWSNLNKKTLNLIWLPRLFKFKKLKIILAIKRLRVVELTQNYSKMWLE